MLTEGMFDRIAGQIVVQEVLQCAIHLMAELAQYRARLPEVRQVRVMAKASIAAAQSTAPTTKVRVAAQVEMQE
jgi:NADH:ubiquinone oxidoreductase subunit E